MSTNPFINALTALVYIVLVVFGIFNSSKLGIQEPNVLIPITKLSLLVFSAAFMAYVFMYQPLQLFLEGEKKKGVDLFLKTLGAFALCAIIFAAVGFYVTGRATVAQPATSENTQ